MNILRSAKRQKKPCLGFFFVSTLMLLIRVIPIFFHPYVVQKKLKGDNASKNTQR